MSVEPSGLIPQRASVRAVVEFSIHGADLRIGGSQRAMAEGAQAHRARQNLAHAVLEDYQHEVALSLTVRGETVALEVAGRADGLFFRGGLCVVEEIKLASSDVLRMQDARPEHWAQAACYGHMLCALRGYDAVCLRVLYVGLEGGQAACFERHAGAQALARQFEELTAAYLRYVERRLAHIAARDAALSALAFPFDGYREGQRAFAANVYVAIRDQKRLLAQAPTGTGKTMAALFPALKALGEGLTGQIFYLTARTTGKEAALAALDRVRESGVPLRALELTAKEKCCPREGGLHCDPAECAYAAGYFLRVDGALEELCATGGAWRQSSVREVAVAHQVCPFECSLALCERADVVVCDYNYAFDPGARLQRVFLQRRDLTLLIDEAHHLVDRGRDMLGAQINSHEIRALRKAWRASHGAKNGLYRTATALLRTMEALRQGMDAAEFELPEPPLAEELRAFAEAAEAALEARALPGRELLNAVLGVAGYQRVVDRYDEAYATLLERGGKELRVRLMCLDPAPYLARCTDRLRGVAAFSATLSPLTGYARLLGMDVESDGRLALPSPFPPERLCVVGRAISTRWAHRAGTAQAVAESVAAMVSARTGNYLCMFPSYAYLRDVRALLEELLPRARLIVQEGGMDEAARADFLAQFVPQERSMLGLAVMGGAFGEGIDLPGDRLSGVAVVGIGLPQVGLERELLRAYYQRALGDGFAYAYRYPGLTRVQQAVGRVIRAAGDVGVALLIDDRFFHAEVAELLPPHWKPVRRASSTAELSACLSDFWARFGRT